MSGVSRCSTYSQVNQRRTLMLSDSTISGLSTLTLRALVGLSTILIVFLLHRFVSVRPPQNQLVSSKERVNQYPLSSHSAICSVANINIDRVQSVGRDRNAGYPAPLAQIPAGAASAPGSCLEFWRQSEWPDTDGSHALQESSGP